VIFRQCLEAFDYGFSDLFRPAISGEFSTSEYSGEFVWLDEAPQVGHIRNFLQKTTSTTAHDEAPSSSWRTRRGASHATQSPAISITVDERFVLEINKIHHAYIGSYALLEVSVFRTSACFLSKCSFEFRHESAGDVEERDQEKKMI
jgi:hypothetical protein